MSDQYQYRIVGRQVDGSVPGEWSVWDSGFNVFPIAWLVHHKEYNPDTEFKVQKSPIEEWSDTDE